MVHSHGDVEGLILLGNTNRTVASTGMNDESSRSHAIFTITFTQVKRREENIQSYIYLTEFLKLLFKSVLWT